MATETKTWSEIKLRNPDQQVTSQMNLIMNDYREASASKALERHIRNYTRDKINLSEEKAKNAAQSMMIMNLQKQLSQAEDRLFNIGRSYKNLNDLLAAEIVMPPVEKQLVPSYITPDNDQYDNDLDPDSDSDDWSDDED